MVGMFPYPVKDGNGTTEVSESGVLLLGGSSEQTSSLAAGFLLALEHD